MTETKPIKLLLLANAISGVSQGITMIAVPWYFTGVLQQEGLFGLVYFTVTALSLFWGIYVGALIDKHDRRKLFLWMNVAGFLVLGGIACIGFCFGALNWWQVALPFAATAFIYNLHFPNLYAYVQEITPKENYSKVNSLLEVQGQISFTLAGGLAAILLHGLDGTGYDVAGISMMRGIVVQPWSLSEIFLVDALTYVVSFIIIYNIKTMPVVERKIDFDPLWLRIQTGLKYLLAHPVLLRFGYMSLMLFLAIIIFSTYLSPMYVSLYLGQGGDVYAFSDMVFSFGALLAGFSTARFIAPQYSIKGILWMLVLAGGMHLLMAATKTVWLFYAANFVIGYCNAGIRVLRVTYIFNHIPNYIIGRTNSVFFVLNVLGRMLLIGLFSLPFFHSPEMILLPVIGLAALCFMAAIFIQFDYDKL